MAFDARETSNHDGAPIALYEFTRGGMAWRYCTADRDVEWGGQTWAAIAISDRGVRQTGETATETFEVAMPADAAVALLFQGGAPPSERVWLKARRLHRGDAEAAVYWTGSVAQMTREDEATAVLACQSLASSFGANGLRLGWQRSCPHMLYDHECGVDRAAFAVAGTAAELDGRALRVPEAAGFADGWFSGGYVEWPVGPGAAERRLVEAHAGGGLLVLLNGTDGLEAGAAVVLYPGCARVVEVCDKKFANLANYGGFPHLPDKSPFDGTIVF